MTFDYENQLRQIERVKTQLLTLERGSDSYNKKLKKLIELVIFTKANAYCLDNQTERRKVTNIIYNLLLEVGLVEAANL